MWPALKEARIKAGATVEALAVKVGYSARQLRRIETGDCSPAPLLAVQAARILNAPELTLFYCRKQCAIGQRYSYEILNNIDDSPVAGLTKLREEGQEVFNRLDRMMQVILNKRSREDLTPAEMTDLTEGALELADLEHTIEVIKLELGRFLDVADVVHKHNAKCCQRGYVRPTA
jgi:transcriptional regulator with XRE-family HTH domain